VDARIAAALEPLLAARALRPQPGRDDKALAAWNGLAIAAFADASRAWAAAGEPERASWARSIAVRAARAIEERLVDDEGRVGRSWRAGRATGLGVLEDHASLAEAFLALYEATFDERWFAAARRIVDRIVRDFTDPAGGWFDTPAGATGLITRPKDLQDNAVPSGNATTTLVLLRLAAMTGDRRYAEAAEGALATVSAYLARYPTGFAQWLVAADFALHPPIELAIVGRPDAPETERLLEPAMRGFRPYQVVAVAADPSATAVPLLGGRFALDGRPTAFVCRDFACRQPVTEPEALAALLVED
jgi:uncharacterized protein